MVNYSDLKKEFNSNPKIESSKTDKEDQIQTEVKANKEVITVNLWLVRHGETKGETDRIIQGQ